MFITQHATMEYTAVRSLMVQQMGFIHRLEVTGSAAVVLAGVLPHVRVDVT